MGLLLALYGSWYFHWDPKAGYYTVYYRGYYTGTRTLWGTERSSSALL